MSDINPKVVTSIVLLDNLNRENCGNKFLFKLLYFDFLNCFDVTALDSWQIVNSRVDIVLLCLMAMSGRSETNRVESINNNNRVESINNNNNNNNNNNTAGGAPYVNENILSNMKKLNRRRIFNIYVTLGPSSNTSLLALQTIDAASASSVWLSSVLQITSCLASF